MKVFLYQSKKFITWSCWLIILWFFIYFFIGDKIPLDFHNPCFNYYFPQILVFTTGATIYLLFIFWINNRDKWYKNLFKFLGGFLLALVPFLIYHGMFFNQCTFWKKETISSKVLYKNKFIKDYNIVILKKECSVNNTITYDTVSTREFLPFLNLTQKVTTINDYEWIKK